MILDPSRNGITAEYLPLSGCHHHGLVPHHLHPGGSMDCLLCFEARARALVLIHGAAAEADARSMRREVKPV